MKSAPKLHHSLPKQSATYPVTRLTAGEQLGAAASPLSGFTTPSLQLQLASVSSAKAENLTAGLWASKAAGEEGNEVPDDAVLVLMSANSGEFDLGLLQEALVVGLCAW